MRQIRDSDMEQINHWYEARGLPRLPRSLMPGIGLIEPGVAAGWLYQTDSTLALIEGIVTNPAVPSELRNIALDAIMDGLLWVARDRGYARVIGYCTAPEVAERSVRHGAKSLGMFTLVVREV